MTRTRLRVEHAERWTAARVDWLEHLSVLSGKLPAPSAGVLDRLSGHSGAEVAFTLPKGQRTLAKGEWTQGVFAAFDMAGTVRRRETADALRAAMVADENYRTNSPGADTPGRFELRLTTTRPRPTVAEGGAK